MKFARNNSIASILAAALLTSGFISGAHAKAPITVLAVPRAGSLGKLSKEAARILKKFRGRAEQVFSESEAQALAKLGDRTLGKSLKLHLESETELASLASWAAIETPLFRIEKDPRVRLTESPLRALQWGLRNRGASYSVPIDDFTSQEFPAAPGEDIGLEGAPEQTHDVIVAVLDSGIDLHHPDLKDVIVRHEPECSALAEFRACVAKQGEARCEHFQVDHDGNGYPLDCNGWNLAPEDDGHGMSRSGPLPLTQGILGNGHVADLVGHGTHVAGIIAAHPGDQGIEGIAPRARILPVRVISGAPNETIRAQETSSFPPPQESAMPAGYGLGDIVARGVLYAVRSGAKVINMSLGWPDPLDSELLRRMIRVARGNGVLLVAASGNDSTDHVIFPCRYDGVICVGAYAPDGALAFFSNYGPAVDVLAPGWNILSTFPMGLLPLRFTDQAGYEAKDGTSMAAPFVSGMLARLLGPGSADEAYSRLILGARKTRPSLIEDPALFPDSSLGGNADLTQSFRVQPQPLILPSRKEAIRVEWDRVSRTLPFRFFFKNHWADARNVQISITAEGAAESLGLDRGTWTLDNWKNLEEKAFDLTLALPDGRIDSELSFRVRVTAANTAMREFLVRAEVLSPVAPDSSSDLKTRMLLGSDGSPTQRKYDLVRTVLSGSDSAPEYLGIIEGKSERTLELLAEDGPDAIRIRGSLTIPSNGIQIKSLHKLSDSRSGQTGYVLVEALPSAQRGQVGSSQLTWLDSTLTPRADRAVQSLDIAVTYLPEEFQWQLKGGDQVATWYSLGRLPPSERKPFDPWNPGEDKKPGFFIFMLGADGIHTLALPKEYPWLVSLLPQTKAQRAAGAVSVLLAKGADYALEYATAELIEGAWRTVRPISLPKYHNLLGIMPNAVISLMPESPDMGTSFSGFVTSEVGPKGSRRTTTISEETIHDFSAYPLRRFDAVTDISGTFSGRNRHAQFSLTKYDIQYHDFVLQQEARTSQKRFSFLPNLLSMKSFFPVLAQDLDLARITGETRIPALFVPGDFIFSKATQVILPQYDSSGRLSRLGRPAKFHLESRGGCTALPVARRADLDGPSELIFFCQDRFLSMPVVY